MKAMMMTVLVGLALLVATAQADVRPKAEGLPLPWPFPWAKECPVDWQTMAGRYVLSNSLNEEQIDLKITVINVHGFRLVRLSRFDGQGHLIADGFSFASLNQRMLRMKLVAQDSSDSSIWALIKLHYTDWNLGCSEDHLVPILTLETTNSSSSGKSYYRLVRAPGP
jgi:hypothetical protein